VLDLTKGDINGFNLYAYGANNPVMNVDEYGCSWKSFWNDVGNWFEDHWVEVAIGVAFILVGAAVTALTAGTGLGFMAAFGSALLSSLTQVGISMAVSVAIGGIISVATGGGFFDNFGDNLASGFMWGGIFAGGAQILSGGMKALAKLGMNTSKQGFFKAFTPNRIRSAKEVAKIGSKGQKYYEYGGTLLKFGKNFIDVSNKTLLHAHLWFTGATHIPLGTILAGIIGGLYD
jgi:hypothetical protein